MKLQTIKDTARIWIYFSSRPFTQIEETTIQSKLNDFVEGWLSHGAPVSGTFEIKYHQFIILIADIPEAGMGGCSIDGSVRIIKELENSLQVNLLDNSRVAYLSDNNVLYTPFLNVKSLIENEEITSATEIFNNAITTYGDLKTDWLKPASETWLKKYFQKITN